MAATPASSKRRAMSSADSSDVSAQPSTATLPSRASSPTATRPGNALRRLLHQRRIAHRRGADDDARRRPCRASLRSSPCRGCRRRAAPECSTAVEDALDRRGVHRLAGEGAVEIDDVQILEALRLERLRLRRRIAVEHGRARHVALLQAHGEAVLQIDGGKQDHGCPLQEIGDQRKPELLALLRMELRADHVVARRRSR